MTNAQTARDWLPSELKDRARSFGTLSPSTNAAVSAG